MSDRVGQVRPSQLLYTYGPGSMVDLPNLSVLVMGLTYWAADDANARVLPEKRLLAAVRRRLGQQVEVLRSPPHLPERTNDVFGEWAKTGVPVKVFPSWLRCPACDRIAPVTSKIWDFKPQPYKPENSRYVHSNCQKAKGKAPPSLPVRFLLTCRNGHLDDFPWVEFTHRGKPCGSAILEMFELGQSTGPEDVFVKCISCNQSSRSLVDAFGMKSEESLPCCRGRHPQLALVDDKRCDQQSRAILLGASNLWFSTTIKVLALPTAATSLGQLVDDLWTTFDQVDSPATLDFAIKNVPALKVLKNFSRDDVWAEIQNRRAGGDGDIEDEDLLAPEWEQFSNPAKATEGEDFRLREVDAPPSFRHTIERVVLAERLREVVALTGFTRVDPPGEPDALGREAKVGPISRGSATWVPCAEVRGEGIFIQFKEAALAEWEARVEGTEHLLGLRRAHRDWRERRKLDPALGWPGERYLLLHTVSHLLTRELALECGYGSASITERLYARTDPEPMAGILLYTAAPDSEGTLGGLVSLGDPDTLDRLLRQAFEGARLCSSDPMCAEHVPSIDEDVLHAAACHACLFAPETACEKSNRYLDRAVAVDTFAGLQLEYFRR
jgi:hypothetical protein